METSNKDVCFEHMNRLKVQTKVWAMEGGEPKDFWRLVQGGWDQGSLIVGLCSCGYAKGCMLWSFWSYKLTDQPSHVPITNLKATHWSRVIPSHVLG